MSVSEGIERFHDLEGLYLNPPQCPCGSVIQDVNIDDLGDDLAECLRIRDDHGLTSNSILLSQSDQNDISKVTKEGICEKACETELATIVSDNCLYKGATLPCSGEVRSFAATLKREDEEVENEISATLLKENDYESAKLDDLCPISLPTPMKLVSAMKGSREKQGAPRKKLTVTWAPDVYDPPPMAPVHVITSKGQRSRSDRKKGGKNRQKSVSKSKKGKDKKQIPKCRSSNRGLKFSDGDFRMVEYDATAAYMELEDVNVESPDSHCASSFLKKAVTRVHFSVAEAT